MRIVNIAAGLGNQLFFYIFGRYVEMKSGETVVFDDHFFFFRHGVIEETKKTKPEISMDRVHNGYELERIFPNLAKPTFLRDVVDLRVLLAVYREALVKTSLEREGVAGIIQEKHLNDMVLCAELPIGAHDIYNAYHGRKSFTPLGRFNSNVAKVSGDVYYYGLWHNPRWFNECKDILSHELEFPPIQDIRNKNYERMITSCLSTGIHIRRGDFIMYNRTTPAQYFKTTIETVLNRFPEAVFFIFSDQISWCREQREELGLPEASTVFVEGNYNFETNYIDIQLMAKCKILITNPMSSFSLVASMLNREENHISFHLDEYDMTDAADDVGEALL